MSDKGTRLRKVQVILDDATLSGWFHGFFQNERGKVFALVENKDGTMEKWLTEFIRFDPPYEKMIAMEKRKV